MSIADPQTDAEREGAECFLVMSRRPGGMWRPYGITLGPLARDRMLAFARSDAPDAEYRAIGLEAA